MRKRIAVFACAISFDNQSRIVRGILERAKQKDMDVYIFTCHINYKETEESKAGAFQIMQLPDIGRFDGAIIIKNSIQYEKVAEDLERRILESGIPAVSVDEPIEGMNNVRISSYDGLKKIVNHLIDVHHISRINYVSGILGNREGIERFEAYQDALKEHGIPFLASRVYNGNYGRESGKEAIRYFLSDGKSVPDAIVFANDAMAIGGMEELMMRGYRIPEDVIVTGFDDDWLSRFYLPSLTTINRKQELVGERAVDGLEETWNGQLQVIETTVACRESCGCVCEEKISVERLRQDYSRANLMIQQGVDAVKNMALELSGLESVDAFYEKIKPYVVNSDMKSFYLCVCDESRIFTLMGEQKSEEWNEFSIDQELEHYTKQVSIPVAYERGKFSSYGAFDSADVLPVACREEKECTYYIVTPVCYQNVCFGYCVAEQSEFPLYSELAYSWTVNLGIALENIRKWTIMHQMMEKMGSMWKYDMLTQVYNRSGFFYYAKDLLRKIKEKDSYGFILFLDLDGLKKINDNLGHEQGDHCIREMADVLRKVVPEKNLVMRYGGDEFVVFGICENEEYVVMLQNKIRSEIDKCNKKEGRNYQLSVSMGYSLHRYQEIRRLNTQIEQADKKMYEEKRKKHLSCFQ